MKQRISYNEKVSRILEPPYFKNMDLEFGISNTNDQLEVLKFIYGNDVTITPLPSMNIRSNFGFCIGEIRNPFGMELYYENSFGSWIKKEYDSNGYITNYEDSNGQTNMILNYHNI
jgi:hypothetical protein